MTRDYVQLEGDRESRNAERKLFDYYKPKTIPQRVPTLLPAVPSAIMWVEPCGEVLRRFMVLAWACKWSDSTSHAIGYALLEDA